MNGLVRYLLDRGDAGLSEVDSDIVVEISDRISGAIKDGRSIVFSGDGVLEESMRDACRELSDVVPDWSDIRSGNGDVFDIRAEGNENVGIDIDGLRLPIPVTTEKQSVLFLKIWHIVCRLVFLDLFGKRAVFIDRDDTIAKDVPYCDDPKKFNLFDDVPKSISRLNDAGFLVIMITNQSGINRGKFTLETLNRIHEKMIRTVEEGGGRIDDIFFCPHRPDENCPCRKPNILMGIRAVEKYDIDPRRSYMVGDSDADMGFGERMGCMTIRVSKEFGFSDAVDEILGL